MPYSNDILVQAKEKLAERRMNALRAADYKREQLYLQEPRLQEIDRELSQIGIDTAKAILKTGSSKVNMRELAERSLMLQEEYNRLLGRYGFTPAAVEPVFVCEKCADTGYIEEDNRTIVCECLKKLMSDIACEQLNAESPLQLCTFETFKLDYYSDQPDQNGSIPLNMPTGFQQPPAASSCAVQQDSEKRTSASRSRMK